MPTGPLGGPRPFAEEQCEPLLSFDIRVTSNRWEYDNPEGMNWLVDIISESTGYLNSNIYIRPSQGPAEARDFYGYIQIGPGEFFDSVRRNVDAMEEKLESVNNIEDVGVTLAAGDPEKKIRGSY